MIQVIPTLCRLFSHKTSKKASNDQKLGRIGRFNRRRETYTAAGSQVVHCRDEDTQEAAEILFQMQFQGPVDNYDGVDGDIF